MNGEDTIIESNYWILWALTLFLGVFLLVEEEIMTRLYIFILFISAFSLHLIHALVLEEAS